MSLDISRDQLEQVRHILKKFVPKHKVLAFGSRVRGTAKKHSDLDLAIISDEPIPLQTMALMKEAFSESSIPFKVDLIDWSLTSDEFRRLIENENIDITPTRTTSTSAE